MTAVDNTSLFPLLACSASTFFLARFLGKWWRDRRDAGQVRQAEQTDDIAGLFVWGAIGLSGF